MSKPVVSIQGTSAVENFIRLIFAGFFFLGMLYSAQKFWRARNTQTTSVKQVFLLCTLFFGIKGFAWLDGLLSTPPFIEGLISIWPSFIQVTAAERLASSWLEIYFMFCSCQVYQHLAERVSLISNIVNITAHLVLLASYCILTVFVPESAPTVLRLLLIVFMIYVIVLMIVSVRRITRVIKEYLGSKHCRKIKLIGVFTVMTFTFYIITQALLIAFTPELVNEKIDSVGEWFSICLLIEYGITTMLFMLVISRAIVAQAGPNKSDKELPINDGCQETTESTMIINQS